MSPALTVHGKDESETTDIYALSLSYDPKTVRPSQLVSGKFCLASAEDDNAWITAVYMNSG